MKAIVYRKYGSPDVLKPEEVKKPVPGTNEVLIKVYAVSINDWDWGLLRGQLLVNRLLFGLFKPKRNILGSDIAGLVEAVGSKVEKFKPGDAVFGDICGRWGGLAEYICTPENTLMLKPASMSFNQAAALPQAGLLALQGLLKNGQVKPGQKVLINGGGGGAGTFALQIARSSGAEVTGVDSTPKLDTMRSVGADHVIDYTREDFTKNGKLYDLIVDFAAHHSIFDYRRSLNPGGAYVMVGGTSARITQLILLGPWISLTRMLAGRDTGKKMGILAHKPNKGMSSLVALFESGKIVPVIDKQYSLNETVEALQYFGEAKVKGKIVITIDQ